MSLKKLSIALYGNKLSSIENAIKQIPMDDYDISLSHPQKPELHHEILIIHENNLAAPIITYLLKQNKNPKQIIFIVPENDSLFITTLLKAGFVTFFVLPYEYYKFIDYLKDLIQVNSVHDEILTVPSEDSFASVIGNSRELRKIIEISKKVADKRDINILITGETGTGKGLLARAIHNYNKSGNLPYVDITCTAIPETLLESELFGYEPGAFTNAKHLKPGLFEVAEKGTLFLDEIGDLSLTIQSKLLRTIEKKVVRRLGGIVDIPISARIISATNKNLEQLIENNSFRRDLFHRLNTVSIEILPLRFRGDDITFLLNYFLNVFNNLYKREIKRIEPGLKEFMTKYSWPGNVRELRNNVERAVLLSDDNTLRMKHFVNFRFDHSNDISYTKSHPAYIHLNLEFEKCTLKKVEKLYAKETLSKVQGNKSKTAKILGISRPKLDDLLKS